MNWIGIVARCALAAALVSCAEPESPTRNDTQPDLNLVTSSDGQSKLLTRHDDPGSAHNFAHFDDGLAINRKGCFAFASNGASIVVPDTWTIAKDGKSLMSSEGDRLTVGQRFTAGGGYANYNKDSVPAQFRPCPGDGPPYPAGLSPFSGIASIFDIRPVG